MKKFLLFATAILLVLGISCPSRAKEPIRVGVYQNKPFVLIDKKNNVKGFYIDVMKGIASAEGLNIKYIPGSMWECLERLNNEEIDVMMGVPYSQESRESYDFTNLSLLSNWAQVYTQKSSWIETILDLSGKTVAGVKSDIDFQEFRFLLGTLGVECNFVELEDYGAVFSFLEQRMADAGLISRVYGLQHEKKYNVDKSAIICCPTEYRFAFPKGKKADLINALDRQLEILKRDRKSMYYRSMEKWFGITREWVFPAWLIWLSIVIGIMLLVLFLISIVLREQLKEKAVQLISRNKQFEEEINERKRVQDELLKAHSRLEKRVEERTSELSSSNELLKKEITERKNTEEKLKHTTADLARSNKELEQFAYVASHDLQEPLRMITSYLHLLEDRYKERLDSDAQEFIDYAVDGASRMHDLIDNLLAYSRVETHGKSFEVTDCNPVLNMALTNLKIAIEKSGAAVTRGEMPKVMADPTQLLEVFQNLVSNAIKFRGADPVKIDISAQQKGSEWMFCVKDNGIGIDLKHSERIFLIFQRLHTRDEYPGAGVGLAICKKIVERHGGRIWLESEIGKGSGFCFTIPAAGA